jgi:hypothetical protein
MSDISQFLYPKNSFQELKDLLAADSAQTTEADRTPGAEISPPADVSQDVPVDPVEAIQGALGGGGSNRETGSKKTFDIDTEAKSEQEKNFIDKNFFSDKTVQSNEQGKRDQTQSEDQNKIRNLYLEMGAPDPAVMERQRQLMLEPHKPELSAYEKMIESIRPLAAKSNGISEIIHGIDPKNINAYMSGLADLAGRKYTPIETKEPKLSPSEKAQKMVMDSMSAISKIKTEADKNAIASLVNKSLMQTDSLAMVKILAEKEAKSKQAIEATKEQTVSLQDVLKSANTFKTKEERMNYIKNVVKDSAGKDLTGKNISDIQFKINDTLKKHLADTSKDIAAYRQLDSLMRPEIVAGVPVIPLPNRQKAAYFLAKIVQGRGERISDKDVENAGLAQYGITSAAKLLQWANGVAEKVPTKIDETELKSIGNIWQVIKQVHKQDADAIVSGFKSIDSVASRPQIFNPQFNSFYNSLDLSMPKENDPKASPVLRQNKAAPTKAVAPVSSPASSFIKNWAAGRKK